MRLKLLRTLSLIVLLGIVGACTPGKRPFLIVEVCLPNSQDLPEFTSEMRSIAQSERMRFIDSGANTEKELRAQRNPTVDKMLRGTLVNMGVERADGMGLTVGNLGLPPHQVAIGFSEGSNAADAHSFANMVVSKITQHWHVEFVPAGTGATGMKNCG
jgi:hypothetical protein